MAPDQYPSEMESASNAMPMVSTDETVRSQRDARIRSMVDSHFDPVWRALKRLGVPPAGVDDATQQVFLVASRRLDEIDARGERAYLLGVALRVASEARRMVARRREVPIDETVESANHGAPPLEDLIDDKRDLERLTGYLASMPDDMREAFVLFELEELSAPKVAELLGVPAGTVASRVRRARDYIRQRLIRKRSAP
jgi:RNA polymerase sigma-70 factor (ECF subfamily)